MLTFTLHPTMKFQYLRLESEVQAHRLEQIKMQRSVKNYGDRLTQRRPTRRTEYTDKINQQGKYESAENQTKVPSTQNSRGTLHIYIANYESLVN